MNKAFQKISEVLNRDQKKSLLVIFFLILIGVTLEVLGIGMIIPLMNILLTENLAEEFPKLIPILIFFGYPDRESLILYSLLLLILVYAVKNLFLAFLTWKKSNFTFSLFANLSSRLLKIYLNRDYDFHVKKNSAELVRNILSETRHFGKGLILSLIDVFVEVLVLVAIVTLLIFVDPLGTVISIVLFTLSGMLYYSYNKKKLTEYGSQRQTYEGIKIKNLNEIFDNIKLITILGKENKFLSNFDYGNNLTANIAKKQNFIQQMPRLFFEFLAIIMICILVIIFINFKDDPLNKLIPTLGIFAAATFRILPSINKILVNSQTIRFSRSAIDLIHEEFVKIKNEKKLEDPIENIKFKNLNLNNISFHYSSNGKKIFDKINLNIAHGKTYGFIGSSGEGKSTLMDILMCIQDPQEGKIIINDNRGINQLKRSWQNIIGYVPQNVFLTDDTIKNNIALGENNEDINQKMLKQSIKQSQLENYIYELDNGLDTIVGENGVAISGGQRQRIGIARALYINPQILILDEITSALDTNTELKIIDELNTLKGDKTILIITHRMSATKYCDEVFKIDNKKLIKV